MSVQARNLKKVGRWIGGGANRKAGRICEFLTGMGEFFAPPGNHGPLPLYLSSSRISGVGLAQLLLKN